MNFDMLHAHIILYIISIGFNTFQSLFQSVLPKHPRKDRYNHKLRKYHVVYGEEDDEMSENEEQHQHQETGDASCQETSPDS